jgi:hypothetical protein
MAAAFHGAGDHIRTHDARPARQPQPRRPSVTHIWIDKSPAAPARTQRRDQAGDFPEGEEGVLLCTIGQDGSTGEWLGETSDGRPVQITGGADGRLEIRHFPNRNGDEDPDQVGMVRPPATAGTIRPGGLQGGADRQRARDLALLRPGRAGAGDVASTGALARLIDDHYRQGPT